MVIPKEEGNNRLAPSSTKTLETESFEVVIDSDRFATTIFSWAILATALKSLQKKKAAVSVLYLFCAQRNIENSVFSSD